MSISADLQTRHYKALKALSIYRFLTLEQMTTLRVSDGVPGARTTMKALQQEISAEPLVDKIEGGSLPGLGRLPDVYFMTKAGALMLAEADRIDIQEISYPVETPKVFGQDYFHRLATIDAHISLRNFCERYDIEVEFFHSYYMRKNEKNGERLSRVELGDGYFIPDGIFALRLPNGRRYLFALEVYNGRDTARVLHQLTKHAQCFADGTISRKYGFQEVHQVLSIFSAIPEPLTRDETRGIDSQTKERLKRERLAERTLRAKNAVMQRLASEPAFANVGSLLGFTTLPMLTDEQANGWTRFEWLDGSVRAIFPS